MSEDRITDWIGRTEVAQGGVDARLAAQFAATLSVSAPKAGDVLPALWHWGAFPTAVATGDLGHDGHPKKGGFLPPIDLPRRMWAGGSVQFEGDIHVGEALVCTSQIKDIQLKDGRAGPMAFVSVGHEITGATGRISERHDIVYLRSPDRYAPPPPKAPPTAPLLEQSFDVSAVTLFRYSACTFNGHRVHYDLDFARGVERYPNIVVHGPLQATCLMRLATEHRGRRPDRFDYRGVHPMFPDAPLRVLAQKAKDGLRLCTARGTEHQGMQATALWMDDA
ncbi:MAG: FAS1-like dehydratase domain-containing protein [Paracoccaceae bacterium]